MPRRLFGTVCLLIGLIGGYVLHALPTPTLRADAPKAPIPNPQAQSVDANLYMQTSAEYRACCLTIYRAAEERLPKLIEAAGRVDKSLAVVMDLDETVFDNGSFQSFLDREGVAYSDPLWLRYERDYPQEVRMVPGAAEFIKATRRRGVRLVYISNRSEKLRASTLKALAINGLIEPEGELTLLLAEETSDKTKRRQLTELSIGTVLMYVGDNLRDFSEAFAVSKTLKDAPPEQLREAIDLRKAQVDGASVHWGIDWFVLPNPVYGEWQKLYGKEPRKLLRPSAMTSP